MALVLIPVHLHTEDTICSGVLRSNRTEVFTPRCRTEIRDIAPRVAAGELAHSCDGLARQLDLWLTTLIANASEVLGLNIEVFNRSACKVGATQDGAEQR